MIFTKAGSCISILGFCGRGESAPRIRYSKMTVNVPYASGEKCQDLMFSTAGFARSGWPDLASALITFPAFTSNSASTLPLYPRRKCNCRI